MSGLRSEKIPALILLTFSLLVTGVVAYSVLEVDHKTERETVTRSTGLEDRELFPGQDGFEIGEEVVCFEGKPLYRFGNSAASKQDWRMIRLGRDETDSYWVYREEPPEDSGRVVDPDIHYLKLGRETWMRLTARPRDEAPGDSA